MSQTYDFSQMEAKPIPLISNQVAPKHKIKYFCRLCRRYDIKTPKTHLRDKHNADYKATQNKAYGDIVKVLFSEVY